MTPPSWSAGPQKELLPTEIEALVGYVARAGKTFFMIDPFQDAGLGPALERWGLGLGNDVIIDINPQAGAPARGRRSRLSATTSPTRSRVSSGSRRSSRSRARWS